MVTRSDHAILADLVQAAEAALARPATASVMRIRFAALRVEITDARRRPCDGERHVDDFADVLGQAIANVIAGGGGDVSTRWQQIVGVLLPIVREKSFLAFAEERKQQ